MKRTKTIIAAICRTLLGVVFVFSGAVKAIDPFGTVYKIEDYLKAFGGLFTELLPLAEVAAVLLILLEVVLVFRVWFYQYLTKQKKLLY